MVVRQVNNSSGTTQIIVTGNRAESWRANVMLAAALGFVSLLFGTGIAFFGFWLVLPLAGLESAFVLWCLWLTYRRLGFMEVISVTRETLTVEWGHQQPERTVELLKGWIEIDFDDPASAFENGTLNLRANGKSYLLGNGLNKAEKRQLHGLLQTELNPKPRLRVVS